MALDIATATAEKSAAPPTAPAVAARYRRYRRYRRGRLSPLTRRILAVNVLAIALLGLGLLYLGEYQQSLIAAESESLATQGQIFAAALGDSLRDPVVSKTLTESLQVSLILGDAQEEAKFLAEQMALWGPVVKENNIKSD